MSDKDFVKKYLEDFSVLIKGNNEIIDKIKFQQEVGYKNFYFSKNRLYEKNFLLSEEFSNFLKQKNIRLINFSDLD